MTQNQMVHPDAPLKDKKRLYSIQTFTNPITFQTECFSLLMNLLGHGETQVSEDTKIVNRISKNSQKRRYFNAADVN